MRVNLSIVLPAYKEKENLAILIPQIETEFQDASFEIIVVDDHSCDGTRELIDGLNQTYHNIILIERSGLLGIGSALRDGYDRADGEYILSSDSDLSFSVQDMRALYEKICTGFDVVLGYKIYKSTKDQKKTIKVWCETFLFSLISNVIISVISGIGLKNYNTNFRIIRASMWDSILTVENRQFFLFETIFRAKQKGAKIAEIPVTFHLRKFGESKVSFFRQAPKYFVRLVLLVFFDRPSKIKIPKG